MGEKRPTKPSDPRIKVLRFQSPEIPDEVIQLSVVDTGNTTDDGLKIHRLEVGGSGGGPMPSLPSVIPPNPVVAVTATAAPLPSQALVSGAVLKAPSANIASVWIGGDNSVAVNNGLELEPGEIIPVAAIDLDLFWIIGNAADTLQWIGG